MAKPRRRTEVVNRGFPGWVVASLLLHGTLVGSVVYAQSLRPPRIDVSDAIPIELVQLGEERDPDLLPRKTKPAPPPPPSAPVPVEPPPPAPPAEAAVPLETAEPDKAKPPPAKKAPSLSTAAQRLLDSRSSADGQLDDAVARLEKAQGSPSGSRLGTTTDPTKVAEGYQREVYEALKAAYVVPAPIPSAQRRFLKATVVLFIDRRGRIKRYEFAERHSNKLFMGALEKLLKTIKLPAPPAALRRRVANDGVVVIFSP